MFDLEQFTADCRAALAADSSHRLVREVVTRAVSDPSAVLKGIGEPKRSEVQKLYHAPDLTILNVIWGPMMTIMPHNHQMWAVIGIYTGREDNVFLAATARWQRQGRSRGGASAMRRRRRTARPQHHSFGYQSDPPPHRRHPRLRRRFFRCRAKRVGPGKLARRSLRYSKKHEVIRRRECANETLCGKAKLESFRIVSARVCRWPAAEIAHAAR